MSHYDNSTNLIRQLYEGGPKERCEFCGKEKQKVALMAVSKYDDRLCCVKCAVFVKNPFLQLAIAELKESLK